MLVELDFAGITARIQVIAQTSPILRFFKSRAILKELAGIKKVGGGKLTMAELSALLPRAQAYAVSRRDYEASAPRAAALLGARWCGGEPDWDGVKTLLDCTRGIYDALCKVCARQPDRVAGCLESAARPTSCIRQDGEPTGNPMSLAAWNLRGTVRFVATPRLSKRRFRKSGCSQFLTQPPKSLCHHRPARKPAGRQRRIWPGCGRRPFRRNPGGLV